MTAAEMRAGGWEALSGPSQSPPNGACLAGCGGSGLGPINLTHPTQSLLSSFTPDCNKLKTT